MISLPQSHALSPDRNTPFSLPFLIRHLLSIAPSPPFLEHSWRGMCSTLYIWWPIITLSAEYATDMGGPSLHGILLLLLLSSTIGDYPTANKCSYNIKDTMAIKANFTAANEIKCFIPYFRLFFWFFSYFFLHQHFLANFSLIITKEKEKKNWWKSSFCEKPYTTYRKLWITGEICYSPNHPQKKKKKTQATASHRSKWFNQFLYCLVYYTESPTPLLLSPVHI